MEEGKREIKKSWRMKKEIRKETRTRDVKNKSFFEEEEELL